MASALISIGNQTIGAQAVQTVNARDLHSFLKLSKDFSDWIKAQLNGLFTQGIDFVVFPQKGEKPGNRPRIEYALTIECAKHLAMMSRTPKGREARDYFIECERRAHAAPAIPQTLPEALRLAADLAEHNQQLSAQIKQDAPKVEFAESVRQMEGACHVGYFAKTMKHGPNLLFARMRRDGLLMEGNLPYQDYINRGWFVLVENEPYKDSKGVSHPTFTTMITGKGQVALSRRYPVGKNLKDDVNAVDQRRAA